MALSVAPVNNPTFTGLGNAPAQTIKGGTAIVATPGSNGFATLAQPSAAKVSTAVSQGQALSDQTNALLAAIARLQNSQPKQVYAPALDFAAISSQARASAEANVNPFYTKQLNDFLAEQAAKRSQATVSAQSNIQQLQDTLKNTLEGNDITKARTTEDTATNLDQIAQQADQNQLDTGSAFNTDRIQQAKDLAAAGLTGGLGAQQTEASTLARNTTEKRAGDTVQAAKEQQVLTKSRTFEDLARSGSLATSAEGTGEKQVNVSLADFITNQGLDLTAKQSDLEAHRQSDIIQQKQQQESVLVQNFINSIADPAQRDAALHAYGGLL